MLGTIQLSFLIIWQFYELQTCFKHLHLHAFVSVWEAGVVNLGLFAIRFWRSSKSTKLPTELRTSARLAVRNIKQSIGGLSTCYFLLLLFPPPQFCPQKILEGSFSLQEVTLVHECTAASSHQNVIVWGFFRNREIEILCQTVFCLSVANFR